MFKFLKDKLKQAVSVFSKKVDEDEGVKKEEVESSQPEQAQGRQEQKAQPQEASALDEDEARLEREKKERETARRRSEEEKARIAAEKLALEEKEKADAEETRILEERQKREAELRRAEEEKLRLLDEENRKKEEALLEEARRKRAEDEARRLEEKRQEDARKKAEEEAARIAYQKRMDDEKRREEERRAAERKKEEEKRAQEEEERLERERLDALEKNKEAEKKQGFFQKLFGKKEKPTDVKLEKLREKPRLILEKEEFEKVAEDYTITKDDEKPEPQKKASEPAEEDEEKGFFGKIKESLTTIKLSDEKFNDLFWDLELGMLENNVAVEVIEKIKDDLRIELTTGKVSRKSVDQIVHDTLKKSIEELLDVDAPDLIKLINSKSDKPFVIAFIGVNGSGKTTTMAKVAHMLLKNKLSVVFAASDTFRAAAIQQLQEHADKLGVKMIRHDYESDPAAVAFDAIKHAKAKNVDVVMIDTAGRLHTNDNLMNELKKLIRVNNPDFKIFIGEAITGNDCVEQAKLFNEAVGIDGIILAKADVDEKGGAALSVSYVTGKPIIYMGTGQTYDDLVKFDSKVVLENIGL